MVARTDLTDLVNELSDGEDVTDPVPAKALEILDGRGFDKDGREGGLRRLTLMVEQGVEEMFVVEAARRLDPSEVAGDGGIPDSRPLLADFDPPSARSGREDQRRGSDGGHGGDPSRFFDKHGLLHADLVDAVLERGMIAAGPGESLWHYDKRGVWRPGGDNEVRRRCAELLGQRARQSHIEGVVRHLRALRPLIGNEPRLDLINCRTGLLNWRTLEMHDHDPLAGSTWQLAVPYNPEAECPTVDAWLAQVAPDDALELVWQVIGAAIYAGLPAHKAVMLFGPGRNGKGTLLRLIGALVGPEHCAAVPLQSLGENRFAVAELYGKAVNLAGDLDARSVVKTDVFKMVTGGDSLHAERKYGQPFTFINQALMIFAANEMPGTADHSDGFHSRWIIVPFTKVRLSPDDIDPTLEPRMHTELEGVFAKAVLGLRLLMAQGGFDTPASVIEATSGYRDTSDPVRRFVDEHITITGHTDQRVTRRQMYTAYKEWCIDENHRPVAASKFWGRVGTIDDRIDPDGATVMGTRYVTGVVLDTPK